MWTVENRGCYHRGKLHYPSDLTDAEWPLIEPYFALPEGLRMQVLARFTAVSRAGCIRGKCRPSRAAPRRSCLSRL